MRVITGRQIKDAIFDILNQLRVLSRDTENYGIALAKHLRIPTTTIDGIEVIEAKKKNKK